MFSQNQQGNKVKDDVKNITNGIESLFKQVETMLNDAKDNAGSNEEKLKMATALKESGLLKQIEEIKERFKEVNQ